MYNFEFNVPASTLETDPQELIKEVIAGKLTYLRIVIPNGHQGLARLRIETNEAPIVPTIGSDPPWIRGDGDAIELRPNILIPGPPWSVKFLGYNDDSTYDHAFIIYMEVE